MLVIKLLGQFSVQLGDRPIDIPSRPAQTLLAYLVLNPGVPQRRERLAGLLWPEATETNARSNLRHALWRIRKVLANSDEPAPDYFPGDDLAVSFNADCAHWLDVTLLSQKVTDHTSTTALSEIVAAYGGEFLPGFYDDWVTLERERLQAQFEQKMEMLIERLIQESRWREAIEHAERWIALGHTPEPAYRALLMAHAALGNRANVKAAYQRCLEALHKELGVTPSEETRTLYQRLTNATPVTMASQTAPASSSAPAPRHNLLLPATPLIGREAELAEITDRLVNDPDCRLLTLIGPGGIGKTRLAVQVALNLQPYFTDGAFITSLEAVTSPDEIAPAILNALGLSRRPQKQPSAQIIDYLREKHLLLLIDNMEHLLEGAVRLSELLSAAPELKIIVTSRERLHLQWEWLYEIHGLTYPTTDSEDVETYGAVQLFATTARRVRMRFSLAAEQADVVHICQLVEGLPLGLELAASWVRLLSCREIARQIEHNLTTLTTEAKDVPARQRSAQAVFEYSWNLLTPVEQATLMKLAAFPAGFYREAAEQVAGAPLSLLFSLVDKSLLRASPTARYDMHTLLRHFIGDKLAQSGQAPEIQRRVLNFYLAYARQHQHEYQVLEEDRLNLMACLELAHNNWLAQIVLDYVEALDEVWTARGHWSDARRGYAWAASAAQAHDDLPAMALHLRRWGQACLEQGDYVEAQEHVQAALDLSQQLGDARSAARARRELARIAIEQADLTKAEQLLAASRTTFEALQDMAGLAGSLYWEAWIHYYYQRYDLAQPLLQETLRLEEAHPNQRLRIRALNLLAYIVMYVRSDYELAEQYCRRAVELCIQLNLQAELTNAYAYLADIHRRQGQLELALHEAEQGLQLARTSTDRPVQAHFLHRLSRIHHDLKQDGMAVAESQQALRLCRELGDHMGEVYTQEFLGQIYARLGKFAEARQVWTEALASAEAMDHPLGSALRQRLADL